MRLLEGIMGMLIDTAFFIGRVLIVLVRSARLFAIKP